MSPRESAEGAGGANGSGRGGGAVGGGSGRISLPAAAIYGLITVVLILLFAVWTIAFQVGRQSGKQEAVDQFNRGLPRGPDPLLAQADGGLVLGGGDDRANGSVNGMAGGGDAGGAGITRERGTQASSAAGGMLTARGWIEEDRRRVGHNYLKLATAVPVEEAERAIAFLAARGVEAMGVATNSESAVEGGAQGGNDSGPSDSGPSGVDRVDLYSLGLAVPSERYRAMADARERHQQLLSRLGSEWMARHRGTVNFARTGWELFRGS